MWSQWADLCLCSKSFVWVSTQLYWLRYLCWANLRCRPKLMCRVDKVRWPTYQLPPFPSRVLTWRREFGPLLGKGKCRRPLIYVDYFSQEVLGAHLLHRMYGDNYRCLFMHQIHQDFARLTVVIKHLHQMAKIKLYFLWIRLGRIISPNSKNFKCSQDPFIIISLHSSSTLAFPFSCSLAPTSSFRSYLAFFKLLMAWSSSPGTCFPSSSYCVFGLRFLTFYFLFSGSTRVMSFLFVFLLWWHWILSACHLVFI